MASHQDDSTASKPKVGFNRRTLIRTGAHVAWTVPAVQFVTQSPASAASGPAALSITASNGGWTGTTASTAAFTVTFNVTNNNTHATTDLRVTFNLPSGVTAVATPPGGWSVFSGDGSGTIVLQRATQLAGNASTGSVTVSFNPNDASAFSSVAINLTASPGGTGTPGSTSTTVAPSAALVVTASNGGWTGASTGLARFAVAFNVTNNGTVATTDLGVTFNLPSGATATVTAPSGWTVTGNGTGSITLKRSPQLAAGGSTGQVSVTFDPNDAVVGNQIAVQLSAAPGNGTSGTATTTVPVSPPVLTVSPATGTWAPAGGGANDTIVFGQPRTITNTDFQATTGLKIVLSIAGVTGPRNVENPLTTTAAAGWTPTRTGAQEVTFTSNSQLGRNETLTFSPTVRTSGNVTSQSGTVSFTVSATNPGQTQGTGTATK